jgi:hypothetical protein
MPPPAPRANPGGKEDNVGFVSGRVSRQDLLDFVCILTGAGGPGIELPKHGYVFGASEVGKAA